ncbi:hypothetical protein NE237_003922 [Protea cynaroides]|uniref:Uncharacterized protein n=1 Tax=Protea cynaroides TaxID=273540 RepID=A0A9Q0KHQ3_9MAGN|nr:hypothetical protein NE237_003922 [Protea cynaroides]
MARLSSHKSFIFPAPPPSPVNPSLITPTPIATGKGIRSAVVDDDILSKYLESRLRVPDLNMPQSRSFSISRRRSPAEIDLRLLLSRDDDSIRQILGSAMEFGVFKIIGLGISADELRSMMAEAELIFPIPVELKKDLGREEFLWFCPGNHELETLQGKIGRGRYRNFSRTMESIFGKLKAIADMVGQILSDYHMGKNRRDQGIQAGMDPILCLHKSVGPILSYNDSYPYALSFFLSDSDHEFLVQSARAPLSFNAMAGSILVTVRKQLQEWSNGEFKTVSGEPNLILNSDGSSSFFVEFMCTPSSLSYKPNQMKKISLHNQILTFLIVWFLYKFFT